MFKTSVFFAFFFPEQKLELILPMPMAHDASISCLQKIEFFDVFWHQKKSPQKKRPPASDCHFAALNTTKIFHAFNWKFADVQRKARYKRLMTSTGWLKYGISFSSLENSKGKVGQVYIYVRRYSIYIYIHVDIFPPGLLNFCFLSKP